VDGVMSKTYIMGLSKVSGAGGLSLYRQNLTLDQGVIRQVESERRREKGKGLNRDDGLECQRVIVFSENLTNCETRAVFVI